MYLRPRRRAYDLDAALTCRSVYCYNPVPVRSHPRPSTNYVHPTIRYEIKYRIPAETAEEMAHHIGRYMTADEHGEGGSACYPVHSLYLDSPGFRLYRETVEGAFSRYKLRARCYSFEPVRTFFLEVKSRRGEAMTKSRALADIETTRAALAGVGEPGSDKALGTFFARRDDLRARPTCWITYDRAAYVGGERSLVRITFDSRVRTALPTPDLMEPSTWYDLPEVKRLVVLEIKYTGSYPAWVAETVRRFHLTRSSMSKYKQGVNELIARDLIPSMRAA